MKIIGVDPGYAIVGWGVMEYNGTRFKTLDYGAITTSAGTDFPTRLGTIYNELNIILTMHKPENMAIEKLFFSSNQKTGIDVAGARGVILLCAQQHQIDVAQYTPIQVKQSVTGYGRAEKMQVMEMTKRLLRLNKLPKPDDTADALAIAIAHAHTNSSRLMFK